MKSDIGFYENCISLGWFCGTASSMNMHGLRSFSGPFDWCFTHLDAVLAAIENDFSDFMMRENLQLTDGNPKEFTDTKYGFYFNHEIAEDLDQEYSAIYEKYQRRIKRFLENIKKPACFLRAVRSEREITYIIESKEYIDKVIKKHNPQNEIVFLVPGSMSALPDDVLWFRLDIERYIGKGYEMRTMFNSSEEFLEQCRNNILPEEKISRNISYDNTFKSKEILIAHCIENGDRCIKEALSGCLDTIDQGVYIWGSGERGISLLDYLLDNGIKVNGIIDNDDKKAGNVIKEITVAPFSHMKQDNMNIIIAVASEKAVTAISKQIIESGNNIKALSYDAIYGYPLFPELSWDHYR